MASSSAARPPRASGLEQRDLVYLALLVAGFLALAGRLWFVCDDAYISFRYARHLAQGEGLRYNLGPEEPVEGYSNPLWVLMAAGAHGLGLDLVRWVPRLSCACGVALVLGLYALLRRRCACTPASAALATASVALFPPFAAWASGGLESVPFALAFLVSFERLVLRPGGPDWRGGALAGSALLLLRAEGFAWCAVLAVLAAWTGWRARVEWRRPLLRWALALSVLFALFLLHRRVHFGRWIANTTRAKVFLDAEVLRSGRDYVLVFALTFLAPLGTLAASIWTLTRARADPRALPVAAAALAFPAFALVVGGDFMCMGRLLVPGFALQALALGLALRELARGCALGRPAGAALGAGLVVLGLLPIGSRLGVGRDVHLVPRAWLAPFHFRENTRLMLSETEQWRMQKEHAETLAREGRALARHTRPGESIVLGAIGAIGFHSQLFVHDRNGLVTRAVAERPLAPHRMRSPGHGRVVPREFFLAHEPTYLEHQLARAGERRTLVETLARWRRKPAAGYAPLVLELGEEFAGELLLLYRRLPAGADEHEAWRAIEQRFPELR